MVDCVVALPYLAVSSVFSLIRLLLMSDQEKDLEILALRHQLAVLERQVDKPQLTWPDRALLAARLRRLPRIRLRQLRLIVFADTVLRWHRDLLRRRHGKASRPKRDHGTLDPLLSNRTPRPHAGLEPSPPAARPA
jgi:putative transposase